MTSPFVWNHTGFTQHHNPITPYIYSVSHPTDDVPEGFNTVEITIDARPHAHLDWTSTHEIARHFIDKGYSILWNLKLGLFDKLPHRLDDEGQWQGLEFTLKHFKETLWNSYAQNSLGINFYESPLFPFQGFPISEQIESIFIEELQLFPSLEPLKENLFRLLEESPKLPSHLPKDALLFFYKFCRHVCCDFFNLLAASLDESSLIFVHLDLRQWSHILSLTEQAYILSPEYFQSLHITTQQSHPYLFGTFKGNQLPKEQTQNIQHAICLPEQEGLPFKALQILEEATNYLVKNKIPFKFVTQTHLHLEWDLIEYLFIDETSLSKQGTRRIQGFIAAGGNVISMDPQTTLFSSFASWRT